MERIILGNTFEEITNTVDKLKESAADLNLIIVEDKKGFQESIEENFRYFGDKMNISICFILADTRRKAQALFNQSGERLLNRPNNYYFMDGQIPLGEKITRPIIETKKIIPPKPKKKSFWSLFKKEKPAESTTSPLSEKKEDSTSASHVHGAALIDYLVQDMFVPIAKVISTSNDPKTALKISAAEKSILKPLPNTGESVHFQKQLEKMINI